MDGAVASELLAKLTQNLQQPDLNVNRQLIHNGQDGKKMGKRCEKDGKGRKKIGKV